MSKYIVDIENLENEIVMTISSNIPSIHKDAVEWMKATLLEQMKDLEDGEYIVKLNSEAEKEKGIAAVFMLNIRVYNGTLTVL